MVFDEEQKVTASDTDVTPPPSPKLSRFLRDVEWFDAITAASTFFIAILTAAYVYYAREQWTALQGQLASLQQSARENSQRFHNEHRPWVVLSAAQLSAEPSTKPGAKAPTITLTFRNSGSTPASGVFCQGDMVMSATEPSEFNPKSANKLYIGGGGQLINVTQGKVTIEDVNGALRSQSSVDGYNSKRLKLYFHGRVYYEDRSKHGHWTKVCIYHVHGQELKDFNACSTGNEMDAEPGF